MGVVGGWVWVGVVGWVTESESTETENVKYNKVKMGGREGERKLTFHDFLNRYI